MVPAPEFLSLTFTLPYHLIQQVSDLAQDTNRSQSEIIAESIRLYLKAWATRQERTRISTFEGFTYQEVAIADAAVEDAPRRPLGASEIPQHAEPVEQARDVEHSAPPAEVAPVPESEPPAPAPSGDGDSDRTMATEVGPAGEPDARATDRATGTDDDAAEATAGTGTAEAEAEAEAEIEAEADTDADTDAETSPDDELQKADGSDSGQVTDGGSDAEIVPAAPDEATAVLQIADPANEIRARLEKIAGEALDSRRLRSELEDIMYEVDMKDFSPPEHSLKVARMARELGEAKGLRGRQLQRVFMAGLVHDIGKACIPDEIIKKPRPSTDEMALIRKYPEFSLDLLGLIDSMGSVAAIVAAHQERWNGSGYPMGLARDDIPVESQIVALCDVYDVLLTERRYRPAYGEDHARQIIEQNVGTLWNPDVANVFLKKIIDPQAAASSSRN
jgi:HD-GYP domain-containing protein (c-di-GMP phosphodiesterase class II)